MRKDFLLGRAALKKNTRGDAQVHDKSGTDSRLGGDGGFGGSLVCHQAFAPLALTLWTRLSVLPLEAGADAAGQLNADRRGG